MWLKLWREHPNARRELVQLALLKIAFWLVLFPYFLFLTALWGVLYLAGLLGEALDKEGAKFMEKTYYAPLRSINHRLEQKSSKH